jgi:hypothetical protein
MDYSAAPNPGYCGSWVWNLQEFLPPIGLRGTDRFRGGGRKKFRFFLCSTGGWQSMLPLDQTDAVSHANFDNYESKAFSTPHAARLDGERVSVHSCGRKRAGFFAACR